MFFSYTKNRIHITQICTVPGVWGISSQNIRSGGEKGLINHGLISNLSVDVSSKIE